MKPERTIIVGGGVGGMALAAAFSRVGLPFVLLERAEDLGEVGSGLGVLPGAVRALESLGIGDELFRRGTPFQEFFLCSRDGRELARVSFKRVFERAGRLGYVLHRGALHAALSARVAPGAVRTGAEVVAVDESDGRVKVHLRGEPTPIEGDLVVGADGLNSVVRRHVLGDGQPRYAGETIFRGISDHHLEHPEVCRELFGAGRRAAFYQLAPGQVYWWATAPLPPGTQIPPHERRAFLEEAFAGWAYGLSGLFASTKSECILQNDIYDRRPAPRWHRGRCGLLGDAAHPTTPNLGQGACMAIEDAIVLTRQIAEAPDAEQAFARFYRERIRRTASTVRLSRWWGKAGLFEHPLLVALRDGALRLGPPGWMERQGTSQYCYDPGGLPVD